MASTTYGTIVIQHANEQGDVTRIEAQAVSAVTPGDLCEWVTASTVQPHSTPDGVLTTKLIALETQTPDSESSATIDVDYDANDTVYLAVAKPGDVYYMWLAASQTAAIGSMLVSNGDGTLKVVTVGETTLENAVVGTPKVAVTTVGSVARIQVRIV